MTYRARSTPPASDWGRFLVRMRLERDWSAVQAHEALHAGLGLGAKSKASYTALEDGKAPSAKQEAFLREYFKSGPTDEDRDPSTGTGGDTLSVPVDLYTRKIDTLVDLVQKLIEQNAALMARLLPQPDPIEGRAAAALDELEAAEEPEPARSTSPPRQPGRAPRSGVGSRGRLAGGLA